MIKDLRNKFKNIVKKTLEKVRECRPVINIRQLELLRFTACLRL